MDQLKQETTPAHRVSLSVGVECRRSYARGSETAQLKNISLTGALIEHDHIGLAPTDKIHIVFKVSGRARKLNATVIWTRENFAGVRFDPTNNRDVQIVDDFMYYIEEQKSKRKNVLNDIFNRVS